MFFKHRDRSAALTEIISYNIVAKSHNKCSNISSTSVNNTYNEASGKIAAVNEPQENEHSSNVMSSDQAYLSFKKDI